MKLFYKILFFLLIFQVLGCNHITKRELFQLAKEQTFNNKLVDAINTYNEIIKIDKTDEGPHIMKGHIYNKLSEFDKAIISFKEATLLNPSNEWAFAGLSNSLRSKNEFKEALSFINQAIELNPNSGTLLNSKGQIHQYLNQHKLAINAFKNAIKLEPNEINYFSNIAASFLSISDYSNAEYFILKALTIDTIHCPTLTNYALLQYKKKHQKKANKLSKKALLYCKQEKYITLLNHIKKESNLSDNCQWFPISKSIEFNIENIENLRISSNVNFTGDYIKIKRITGQNEWEIENKKIFVDSLTQIGICKDRYKFQSNNLAQTFYVDKLEYNPMDTISNESFFFLNFKNQSLSFTTIWEKIGKNKIRFKETLGQFFNEGKYSGSWIEKIYQSKSGEFIFIGKNMGGDGGYTQGGIWIGKWKPGSRMRIIKRFDFVLYGHLIDDIDYYFDFENKEITLSSKKNELKNILPTGKISLD